MLRCKQVSDALAAHRYWELPWHQRLGMRLHVLLCFVCGRYNRQIMDVQDAARGYLDHEEATGEHTGSGLSADRRDKIRKLLSTNH
jgi:hypothetical protein